MLNEGKASDCTVVLCLKLSHGLSGLLIKYSQRSPLILACGSGSSCHLDPRSCEVIQIN